MAHKVRFLDKHPGIGEMLTRLVWVFSYAKKYWKYIVIYTLIGLTGTVTGLFTSFLSRDMVDIITGHQVGEVLKTFCIMIGVALGNTMISQLSSFVSVKISMKIDTDLKRDFFSKILYSDWEMLAEYHTGDITSRWAGDIKSIETGILTLIPNLVVSISRFVMALVVMLSNDWTFAVISLVSMPLSIAISRLMMKRMAEDGKKSAEINAQMNSFNQETFSNIQTIKAFSLIPEYILRLQKIQIDYVKTRIKYQKHQIITLLLNVLLSSIVSYSAYGWGIYRVWSGAITYGNMTMFLSLSSSLMSTGNAMTSFLPSLISISVSAGRLMEILELPKEDYSNDEEVMGFGKKHQSGGITVNIDHIGYAYRNGNLVFEDASFRVSPHETIALVGPSGEGKTTMLRIVLALVRMQKGKAFLSAGEKDNEDTIPLNASARQLFSYVPQGNTMLTGTIAENMRFVKQDATEEEIWDALEMACAKEFVEKIPEGLEFKLKERGGGISEGQAQRLSIARALLRKSPILLLDEATSALDVATEKRMLNNIMKDDYPRTCIVTTHRPSVLNSCNRVYEIHDKKCILLNQEQIEKFMSGEEE